MTTKDERRARVTPVGERDDSSRSVGDPAPVEPAPVREKLGVTAALTVVLVLAALVGAGWWYAHHRAAGHIAHGTTIAGVEVGGGSRAQAAADLRRGLAARVAAPITLDVGDRAVRVDPRRAGLAVDYAASVDRAVTSRSWEPAQLWDYFTGGVELAPVVTVDADRLRREVTHLVGTLGVAPRDADLTFAGGTVHVVAARDGRGVDVGAVGDALVHAFLADEPSADVTPTRVAPRVGDAQVQRFLDRSVNPALRDAVTLDFAGHPVRLSPTAFVPALTVSTRPGAPGPGLVLGVDAARLMPLVRPAIAQAGGPVDATVRLVDGRPVVVPARRGAAFPPSVVARVFRSLLARPEAARTASVPPTSRPASFTTADAARLRVVEPVSVYSTRGAGRQTTSSLTAQAALVDGTVLRPGRTFSLTRVAGAAGGDLTQLATTLYNAAFYAGLRDVAHTAPTPHVPGYPLGREATASPGGPDLRFADDTRYGVLVQARVVGGRLTVTLWSRRTWQVTSATSCRPSPGASGVDEVVTSRIFTHPGGTTVDHLEKDDTNYTGLPARVCAGAGTQAR